MPWADSNGVIRFTSDSVKLIGSPFAGKIVAGILGPLGEGVLKFLPDFSVSWVIETVVDFARVTLKVEEFPFRTGS